MPNIMLDNNYDILGLIEKKKNFQPLTYEEFAWLGQAVLAQKIPDYQLSAFLMALFFAKLNLEETYFLTKVIITNSALLQYPAHINNVIDKHSTGGVGDKVSLILLPLLAACQLKIAKISGRSLGYTGGTIDKLHAIGIQTNLNNQQMVHLLETVGFFIIEQTAAYAPLDKIFYQLRNASGSVDDLSLIAASVISKKIITNPTSIYLDVKVGDGAFFADLQTAQAFGQICAFLARKFHKKITLFYTNMQQPLGAAIGSLCEVQEAAWFLAGYPTHASLKALVFPLAARILVEQKRCYNQQEAYVLLENIIQNQTALVLFDKWLKSQKANMNLHDLLTFTFPKYQHTIKAAKAGYLSFVSIKQFGYTLNFLQTNKQNKNNSFDYQSGLFLHKHYNDYVAYQENVLTLYDSNPISMVAIAQMEANLVYLKEKAPNQPMVWQIYNG